MSCPTAPAPQTATTSPGRTAPSSAPIQPAGAASEANTARSSLTGVGHGERARRRRTAPGRTRRGCRRSRPRGGVAEAAAGAVPPGRSATRRVGAAVVAAGVQPLPAVPAAAAGHGRADHHPVADAVPAHRRADLDHLAEELVPEHVAGGEQRAPARRAAAGRPRRWRCAAPGRSRRARCAAPGRAPRVPRARRRPPSTAPSSTGRPRAGGRSAAGTGRSARSTSPVSASCLTCAQRLTDQQPRDRRRPGGRPARAGCHAGERPGRQLGAPPAGRRPQLAPPPRRPARRSGSGQPPVGQHLAAGSRSTVTTCQRPEAGRRPPAPPRPPEGDPPRTRRRLRATPRSFRRVRSAPAGRSTRHRLPVRPIVGRGPGEPGSSRRGEPPRAG